MSNNRHTNTSQQGLLNTVRTHPGKTASEYANLALRGVLSVLIELDALVKQGKITSPLAKTDPATGDAHRAYYPVFQEPEVTQGATREQLIEEIETLNTDNARLKKENANLKIYYDLMEKRIIQLSNEKR